MASDINVCTLTGRLTKDAIVREVSDRKYYSFTVAVSKTTKQGDEWVEQTSFIDVTYGTKSNNVGQNLTKGRQVSIAGSLKQERWEKEGQKFSKVVVVVDRIVFISTTTTTEKTVEDKQVQQGSLIDTFEDTEEDLPF